MARVVLITWINNLSFGWKMGIALVLLGVLPVMVTSLLPSNAADSLEAEVFDQLEAIAEIKVLSVNNWLDERRGDLALLADRDVLVGNPAGDEGVSVLSAYKDDRTRPEFRYAYDRALAAMNSLAAIHPDEYQDVMLLDRDGDMMAQTNLTDAASGLEANVANREFFTQGLQGLYITDVVPSLVTGEPQMFIARPLHDAQNQVVGVLALEIELNSLTTLMSERAGLGQSGETYLVGPDMLFRSESRFLDDLGLDSSILNPAVPVDTVAVNRALVGNSNVEIIDDYRGVSVLSAWQPVTIRPGNTELGFEPLTWALMAEIDSDEVLAPARQQRQIDLIAAVVAAAVATGLALLFMRLMARQVREMETVFNDIRIGTFDTRAKVYGQDELGRTAEGINALLDLFNNLLQESEAEAQERIRTLALLGWAWEVDTEWRLTYCSDSITGVLGYRVAEIIGQSLFDLLLPREADRVRPLLVNLAQQRLPIIGVELWNRHQDGTMVCLQLNGLPVLAEDGALTGYRGAAKDITETKRVSRDLEQAVAQVTDASASMADVIKAMTEQASNSVTMADQASASAQQGDAAVNETIAAMTRIRNNTQETARSIKRLGEVSQEISEVVRLIEDIADRTTVLALNASIQAAAAGDAGRGFAVVAEEVQRLAERATGATHDIENLVKSIQAETNEAVASIEDTTHAVVDGSQLAQQAGNRMLELNVLVGQLAQLVQQTSEITVQQTGTSVATLLTLSQNLQDSMAAFGVPRGADERTPTAAR